jgi:hypothetical protein
MTELNNISTAHDVRELRDDELDHVAGGGLIGDLVSDIEADIAPVIRDLPISVNSN